RAGQHRAVRAGATARPGHRPQDPAWPRHPRQRPTGRMTAVSDWRDHTIGDPMPCRICSRPALMRDADGVPCHKTCAEQDASAPDDPLEMSTKELPTPTEALLRNAIRYADHGWPVFLLGRTKRPLANCDPCKHAPTGHDPAACECLTCHGFYAATTDPERLTAMCALHPRGMLAIRTGT